MMLVAVACKGNEPTRAATTGTAPVVKNQAGTVPAALYPPPPGATTLEGIALDVEHIGDVAEPVAFTSRSGTTSLYVAEKAGKIKEITVDKQLDRDGNVKKVVTKINPAPMLDITRSVSADGERGLLGIAFSSDGRRLYVDYTDKDGAITVDEYQLNDNAVDTRSKRNLMHYDHPFPNHNGGQIAFGPDGYLYVGIGDGGGQEDPNGNGQNTGVPYGKILRVDPEGATREVPYSIPDGNPFKDGQQGMPEVWAFGLRNPWRFSWDKATGDLWIGDVGQYQYEEIDFLPAVPSGAGRGANLGWNAMEGSHPFKDGKPPAGYTPPIFDYDHSNGECSITGGYVYRGKAIPALSGVYVYADYCNGEVRGLLRGAGNTISEGGFGVHVPNGKLESNGSITSFGQDNDGELYILSAAGGVYRIVPGATP